MWRQLSVSLVLTALPASVWAEDASEQISVESIGHILQPKKLEATQTALAGLKLPDGFHANIFASGLINMSALRHPFGTKATPR